MQKQLFGYTGQVPAEGYAEFLQVHEAGDDGSVLIVTRGEDGHHTGVKLSPEKRAELAAILRG